MATDNDIVPNWRYRSSRIYVISSDSGRYRLLPNIKMANKNRK